MGRRVNNLNRWRGDEYQQPKVSWALRSRVCRKYGHKADTGERCPRCAATVGQYDNPFDGAMVACVRDYADEAAFILSRSSPLFAYLNRRAG